MALLLKDIELLSALLEAHEPPPDPQTLKQDKLHKPPQTQARVNCRNNTEQKGELTRLRDPPRPVAHEAPPNGKRTARLAAQCALNFSAPKDCSEFSPKAGAFPNSVSAARSTLEETDNTLLTFFTPRRGHAVARVRHALLQGKVIHQVSVIHQ